MFHTHYTWRNMQISSNQSIRCHDVHMRFAHTHARIFWDFIYLPIFLYPDQRTNKPHSSMLSLSINHYPSTHIFHFLFSFRRKCTILFITSCATEILAKVFGQKLNGGLLMHGKIESMPCRNYLLQAAQQIEMIHILGSFLVHFIEAWKRDQWSRHVERSQINYKP